MAIDTAGLSLRDPIRVNGPRHPLPPTPSPEEPIFSFTMPLVEIFSFILELSPKEPVFTTASSVAEPSLAFATLPAEASVNSAAPSAESAAALDFAVHSPG